MHHRAGSLLSWNTSRGVCTTFIYISHQTLVDLFFLFFFVQNALWSVSVFSWFWGPVVTLQDCLAAFFARDELKGKQVGVNLFY